MAVTLGGRRTDPSSAPPRLAFQRLGRKQSPVGPGCDGPSAAGGWVSRTLCVISSARGLQCLSAEWKDAE